MTYLDLVHVGEDLISVLGSHGDVLEVILHILLGVGLLDEVSRDLKLASVSSGEDTGVEDWVESGSWNADVGLLLVLGTGVSLVVLIVAVPDLHTTIGGWNGHAWRSTEGWGDAKTAQSWAETILDTLGRLALGNRLLVSWWGWSTLSLSR